MQYKKAKIKDELDSIMHHLNMVKAIAEKTKYDNIKAVKFLIYIFMDYIKGIEYRINLIREELDAMQ